MVLYQMLPLPGCTRAWCKRVEQVIPARGNGWDIQGPFVPLRGMGDEGWVLCLGERHENPMYTRLSAWRIERSDAGAVSLRLLATNPARIPLSLDQMEEAYREFPQLSPVLHLPNAWVLWKLLRELKAQQVQRTEGPERIHDGVRKMRLD
jgi:hypothetical protein